MSFLLITVWFSVVCCEKQFLIDLGQMSKIFREEIVFSSLVLWMKELESCSSAVRPHSTISWSFCLCWREMTVSVWGFNINDDDAQIPFSYPSSQPSIFGIHSFLGSKLEVLNCFFFSSKLFHFSTFRKTLRMISMILSGLLCSSMTQHIFYPQISIRFLSHSLTRTSYTFIHWKCH